MGTKAIFPLQIAGMSEAGYEEGHDKTRVLIIEAESYFHVSLIFSQNEICGVVVVTVLWIFLCLQVH